MLVALFDDRGSANSTASSEISSAFEPAALDVGGEVTLVAVTDAAFRANLLAAALSFFFADFEAFAMRC